jgi:hypothetical protein
VLFAGAVFIHNVAISVPISLNGHSIQDTLLSSSKPVQVPLVIPSQVVHHANNGIAFLNQKIKELAKADYRIPEIKGDLGHITFRIHGMSVTIFTHSL